MIKYFLLLMAGFYSASSFGASDDRLDVSIVEKTGESHLELRGPSAGVIFGTLTELKEVITSEDGIMTTVREGSGIYCNKIESKSIKAGYFCQMTFDKKGNVRAWEN